MNRGKRQHFLKVARQMNNYVAATSRQYYYYPPRYHPMMFDRAQDLYAYQHTSLASYGFGTVIANELGYIGMPTSIMNLGYRLGHMFDFRG